ncbi:C6 transcription factor [Colletotrichum truncatum]|uniref:C6 transcription factor n=1 Tax=Colletotrichum truncatum TaxID=5467 RepID=A0ACC3YVE9_COLTU|nr:C6 transcription factor [Colletotrichum truncatum]KAF6781584.1 C6 transcription factor [Colletotrichum truncatum]
MPPAHACDACKRRKVKCDGIEPCANCRLSQLQCRYSTHPNKRSRGGLRTAERVPSHGSALDATGGGVIRHTQTEPDTIIVSHLEQTATGTDQLSPPWLLSPGLELLADTSSAGAANSNVSFHYDAAQIHRALLVVTGTPHAPESILDVAHECIDFFMQYLFPNTPIAHEPTLRDAAALLAADGFSAVAGSSPCAVDTHHKMTHLRRFSLVTALCAFVTSVMPEAQLSRRATLSKPFLAASRAMLQVYEDHDLENPDSTSLTIRMWQSAAMQNTTGRVGTSYQYHAEAAFIAQRLRLHDESAVQQHTKLESQILRASFWLLYLADKTSIALETRPPILQGSFTDDELTLLDNGQQEEPFLDTSKPINRDALESRLFLGFHLKRRIWAAAADLLLNLKSFSRNKGGEETLSGPGQKEKLTGLAEMYLSFTSLVDQLPMWLRNPDNTDPDSNNSTDHTVAAYQRLCFWTQRSNIMTVFHCMRLVILQRSVTLGIPSVVGLDGQPMSCAIRKIELVHDFLQELQMVPFKCFKVQGETAVERIRRVGIILLELVHNAESKTIEQVARSQFKKLLDFLSKLDSKASDKLAGTPA